MTKNLCQVARRLHAKALSRAFDGPSRDEMRSDESRRFEATRADVEFSAGCHRRLVVLADVRVCPVEEVAGGWQAELCEGESELSSNGLIAGMG